MSKLLWYWRIVPMRRWQRKPEVRRANRENGLDWPLAADTMIGLKRLTNLQFAIKTVLDNGIPGDLLEAGVWRGGASIFMQGVLMTYGDTTRQIWVCDSFQGLPPPDVEKHPTDRGDRHHAFRFLAVSKDEVERNFEKYDLLRPNIRFVEGFFEETLPTLPIEQVAVLRLDGDMYGSTMVTLNSLYDAVSPGGFIIIDDYNLKPCVAAVADFRGQREIRDEIIDIDGCGIYWRKSSYQ